MGTYHAKKSSLVVHPKDMKLVGRIPLSEFEDQSIRRLVHPPYDVAVIRTSRGFRALEDACNHAGASLAEGYVLDHCLICPVHRYAFDLDSGVLVRPKGLCGDQRTFVAAVEGDEVVIYDPFKLVLVT